MKGLDLPTPDVSYTGHPGVSYTGHSLRRGGASTVHAINVCLPIIMHLGLWKVMSESSSLPFLPEFPELNGISTRKKMLPTSCVHAKHESMTSLGTTTSTVPGSWEMLVKTVERNSLLTTLCVDEDH
jgi:hypothetical protein